MRQQIEKAISRLIESEPPINIDAPLDYDLDPSGEWQVGEECRVYAPNWWTRRQPTLWLAGRILRFNLANHTVEVLISNPNGEDYEDTVGLSQLG